MKQPYHLILANLLEKARKKLTFFQWKADKKDQSSASDLIRFQPINQSTNQTDATALPAFSSSF
jgi:hypothetical protein